MKILRLISILMSFSATMAFGCLESTVKKIEGEAYLSAQPSTTGWVKFSDDKWKQSQFVEIGQSWIAIDVDSAASVKVGDKIVMGLTIPDIPLFEKTAEGVAKPAAPAFDKYGELRTNADTRYLNARVELVVTSVQSAFYGRRSYVEAKFTNFEKGKESTFVMLLRRYQKQLQKLKK